MKISECFFFHENRNTRNFVKGVVSSYRTSKNILKNTIVSVHVTIVPFVKRKGVIKHKMAKMKERSL